jgi:hypothetical protein
MLVEFESSIVLYGGKVLLVALGQPAVVLDLFQHLPVLVAQQVLVDVHVLHFSSHRFYLLSSW